MELRLVVTHMGKLSTGRTTTCLTFVDKNNLLLKTALGNCNASSTSYCHRKVIRRWSSACSRMDTHKNQNFENFWMTKIISKIECEK